VLGRKWYLLNILGAEGPCRAVQQPPSGRKANPTYTYPGLLSRYRKCAHRLGAFPFYGRFHLSLFRPVGLSMQAWRTRRAWCGGANAKVCFTPLYSGLCAENKVSIHAKPFSP
jgi:hypothetical protein